MSYRLLLHSPIPVVRDGGEYHTLDLWAVDLAGQLGEVDRLVLVCPVVGLAPPGWPGVAPLPAGIEVVDVQTLSAARLDELLGACDLVQTYGGQDWRASRLCRRLITLARGHRVKSIVGLSSNRARTLLMNASLRTPRGVLAAGRSLARYVGMTATYRWLTTHADGTFIVGEGLRGLVAKACPTLHVGIASWTRRADLAAARARAGADAADRGRRARLCIASRLEPMKGVHLGIDALGLLHASGRDEGVTLTIFGAGPERERLEAQATREGLAAQVTFGGVLAYPVPFLERLGEHGIVVLPNLNDEQPRLVFDAISRGCLPLCPDRVAYRALGLPGELLYSVGDSRSLADALAALLARGDDVGPMRQRLMELAEGHTLETMHARRAGWIRSEVLGSGGSVALDAARGNGH